MGSFMAVLFAECSYGDQIAECVKCVAGTRNACFILDRKCENSITLGRTRCRWRSGTEMGYDSVQ
jgi:hypothetical protein